MKMHQRVQACLLLAVAVLLCAAANAQDKKPWASDSWFEVRGRVLEVQQGRSHTEVILQTSTEHWTIRLGEPWRNRRAGLDAQVLAVGQTIAVYGHKLSDEAPLRLKALRVRVDGRNYDLYPGQIR